MRQLKISLPLLFVLQMLFAPSIAQWTRDGNGINGGNVTSLAKKGAFIFAATERGGIFRSDDNGVTWVHSSTGLRAKFISNIVVKDELIIATGYQGGGVYVSADDGNSWQEKSTGLPPEQITSMLVTGDSLLVGTFDGIFVSTNNGDLWLPMLSGLPVTAPKISSEINALFKIGNSIGAGVFNRGAYVLENGIWTPVADIPSDAFVLSGATKNDFSLIGTTEKLYRSTDGGNSWLSVTGGLPNTYFRDIAFRSDSIIVATLNGLYISTDETSSWTEVFTGISAFEHSIQALLVDSEDIFLGRQHSGVTYSPDGGSTWETRNNGITALRINSISVLQDAIVASTDAGSFRSEDNAENWHPTDPHATSVAYSVSKGDSILGIREHNGPMYVSADKGLSWTPFIPELPGGATHMVFSHEGDIYATGTDGLMTLKHDAANWTPVPLDTQGELVYMMVAVSDTLIAATQQHLFVSYDRGAQWNKITQGLPQTTIHALFMTNGKLFVSTNEGLYLSNSAASEWEASINGTEIPIVLHAHAGFVFAGKYEGVSFSPDFGKTWINSTSDYPATLTVVALNADVDKVYAGTWEGMWSRPLSEFMHKIFTFEPSAGAVGTEVSITGENFSADPSAFTIFVNGTKAEVTSATPTAISFVVPPGATSGPLSIDINGRIAESSEHFCVAPDRPTITSSSADEGVLFTSSSTSSNQWYFNGTPIPDETAQTLIPTVSGLYQVMVLSEDCSSELSEGVDFLITSLGPSLEKPILKAFPVPTATNITVESYGFSADENLNVLLFDITGRVVYEDQAKGEEQIVISMNHLPHGVYMVSVRQGSSIASLRIIKQ